MLVHTHFCFVSSCPFRFYCLLFSFLGLGLLLYYPGSLSLAYFILINYLKQYLIIFRCHFLQELFSNDFVWNHILLCIRALSP